MPARRRRTSSGKFLFSGYTEQEKQVSVLSGGERRRLSLAVVVASGANFLVLDEPTNHLDLESREALEAALEAFPGAVLLVSHDRALLDAVAERTVAIEDHALHSYEGGWADLVQSREERETPRSVAARRAPEGADGREGRREEERAVGARAGRAADHDARERRSSSSRRSSPRTGRTWTC